MMRGLRLRLAALVGVTVSVAAWYAMRTGCAKEPSRSVPAAANKGVGGPTTTNTMGNPSPPLVAMADAPSHVGMTLDAVVTKLGPPRERDRFTIADVSDEFRIELLRTYPKTNPNNLAVVIQELWWDFGDAEILTIWFHQVGGRWVAVDQRQWSAGTQF